FGEDYVKQKGYLHEGYFVQVKGKILERFRQAENWNFDIVSMQLLSELRDKLAKSLTVQIPLESLDEELYAGLKSILEENESREASKSCQLRFKIVDQHGGISLDMPSKSIRIHPDNHFIESLVKLEGVSYRLN